MTLLPAFAIRRRRSGFTLVEVALAMGVLLMGVTVVLGLLSFGAALGRTAVLRSQASAGAEAIVEDLRENLFVMEEGELTDPKPVIDQPVPGFPDLTYNAVPTVNPDNDREFRVQILMQWKSGGRDYKRTFETLLLREIPFGARLRREFIEGEPKARSRPLPRTQ